MHKRVGGLRSKSKNKPLVESASEGRDKEVFEISELLFKLSNMPDVPSFISSELDYEQIWQQIELRNKHVSGIFSCSKDIDKIERKRKKKPAPKLNETKEQSKLSKEDSAQDTDPDSKSDDDDMLQSIRSRLQETETNESDIDFQLSDEENDDDVNFDFDFGEEIDPLDKPSRKAGKKTKNSSVDDRFFKLDEMNAYLDAEDAKEAKRLQKSGDSSDDEIIEDEDFDYFQELQNNHEMENARYDDFFDPPKETDDDETKEMNQTLFGNEKNGLEKDGNESDDDDDDVDENELLDKSDDNLRDAGSESELSENDENDEEEDMEYESEDRNQAEKTDGLGSGANNEDESDSEDIISPTDKDDKEATEIMSTFEKKQKKLLEQAKEMEELSLKETSWELTGETSAFKRPKNSLLETVLDFQHTSKAAPVITDDTTKTLEDLIIQRIKDKAFDDVERKEKPKEEAFEFKKRIVLDQEKSKQSLGEIYEQEFLRQQKQDNDEVKADPECEKIEKDLQKLFQQLDALTNFRYTPIKPGTEVKIVVNTPSIALEEVAPTATTDADLLAPEEVLVKKKGELKSLDERTPTDKKRQRRQKKLAKKESIKAKEAKRKMFEKNKGATKGNKKDAMKEVEKLKKSGEKVTVITGENKKLSSSTAFFSQLQDEVETQSKTKKANKKREKKQINAKKLLL